MTYNPEIPTDLPPPNVAVASIQTDFSQYNTQLSVNHVSMNDSNQGKHANVILQEQSADPGITNNFDALYCKSVTSTLGTSDQLFLQIPQFLPGDKPNKGQQLTFNVVNTAGPQFQSFLPGGYIFYFGAVTGPANTITLSPIPTKIIVAIAQANNALPGTGTVVNTIILTSSTFSINALGAAGGDKFTWMAIAQQ